LQLLILYGSTRLLHHRDELWLPFRVISWRKFIQWKLLLRPTSGIGTPRDEDSKEIVKKLLEKVTKVHRGDEVNGLNHKGSVVANKMLKYFQKQ
jgi:hypothetical protein